MVWSSVSLWSGLAFPWWLGCKHLSTHLLAICISSLQKHFPNLYTSFPFCFFLLLLSYRNSLYILDINSWSQVTGNRSLHSRVISLPSFECPFSQQGLHAELDSSSCLSTPSAFGIIVKNCAKANHMNPSLCFQSFVVLALMFGSGIHSQINSV